MAMPLEEKDMDEIYDLGCKLFLKKMKSGEFYSYQEISKLILENPVHRPHIDNSNTSSSQVLDMAYVEAVIQAQYAVGNLRAAEKDENDITQR